MMDNLRLMLAMMPPDEFRVVARERELEAWRNFSRR